MADVLIYADTLHSPELRHEVPTPIIDPFLYVEHDGTSAAVLSQLDAEGACAARPGLQILTPEQLGIDDLLAAGTDAEEALIEIAVRACAELGVERAVVPSRFPLEMADRLRARVSICGSTARRSRPAGASNPTRRSKVYVALRMRPKPAWS